MVATVIALRAEGYKLGIVTNGRTTSQNPKIDVIGIRPNFDAVVVSEAVGIRKPDPGIFLRAMSGIDAYPEDAWFVGDNPVADILGASNVGMVPVWMRGSHDWPGEYPQPSRQIDSLPELLYLLP